MVRIIKHKNCVYKLSLCKGLIQFLSSPKKKKKTGLSQGERFQNAFGFNNHIFRKRMISDIIRFLEISPTLVITQKEDSQELEIRLLDVQLKLMLELMFSLRESERDRVWSDNSEKI